MYRQAKMQEENQQILNKLGGLPLVNDTYTQVADIYQRTKEHNRLFRAYFGVAEYATKAVVHTTVPVLYYCFQSHIDRANDFACDKLDYLEEKYPIIASPTQEILEEGQSNVKRAWAKVEPVAYPVVMPAKAALKAGQAAVNAGSSLASSAVSTALLPAKLAARAGSEATAAIVKALGEAGDKSQYKELCLNAVDLGLDRLEDLCRFCQVLDQKAAPSEDDLDKLKSLASRQERAQVLARQIKDAVVVAAGDPVRLGMLAGSLVQKTQACLYLHDILTTSEQFLIMSRDGVQLMWEQRQEILDAVDAKWNQYTQHLPSPIQPPEDPVKRMLSLLTLMVDQLGAVLASGSGLLQGAGRKFQPVLQSCVSYHRLLTQQLRKSLQTTNAMTGQLMTAVFTQMANVLDKLPVLTELLRYLFTSLVACVVTGQAKLLGRETSLKQEENIEMSQL